MKRSAVAAGAVAAGAALALAGAGAYGQGKKWYPFSVEEHNPPFDMMPHITIANVACGFHASDPTVMARTVRLAKQHKVRVGAHPSLPDLQGFGRREMKMPREELTNCLIYQIGALKGFLDAAGMRMAKAATGRTGMHRGARGHAPRRDIL